MTTTTTGRVTLRVNYGSLNAIARVFAFDPQTGQLLVKLDDGTIGEVMLSEVEALDAARNFADAAEAARRTAGYVVPRA